MGNRQSALNNRQRVNFIEALTTESRMFLQQALTGNDPLQIADGLLPIDVGGIEIAKLPSDNLQKLRSCIN